MVSGVGSTSEEAETWPPQLTATSSTSTINENSLLSNGAHVETYFSDERILIPESENVITIYFYFLIKK